MVNGTEWTYEDSLEIRGVLAGALANSDDDGGQLRDVMAGVALAGDVEVAAPVLGEPLEPVEQEDVRVHCRRPVASFVVVRRRVGVGEPDSGRRLKEDDVGHCMMMFSRKKRQKDDTGLVVVSQVPRFLLQ